MENYYKIYILNGLVPPYLHGFDYLSVIINPGRYIELLLLIIAACDWASLPCTRKHRRKLETLIESFGVVVAGALEGDTRFRGYVTLVAT